MFRKTLIAVSATVLLTTTLFSLPASASTESKSADALAQSAQTNATLTKELVDNHKNRMTKFANMLTDEREESGFQSELLLELEKELTNSEPDAGIHAALGGLSPVENNDRFQVLTSEALDAQYETLTEEIQTEWTAEHERLIDEEAQRQKLAEEQAAAAAAAQAAAEQAQAAMNTAATLRSTPASAPAAPAPTPAVPAAPAAPVASYNLRLGGVGHQAELDACVGAITLYVYPMPVVGEHWHCGGAAFPKQAGLYINVGGVMYQSVGIVQVVQGSTTNPYQITQAYDLLYQTCLNNNPNTTGFVGLVRV